MNIIHLLYMDKPNGLENIKQMYEKLSYFDQYGASVIMSIIITFILIVIISYCYAMINAQPIIDDWANQRCKPQYIPIAGFITHPDGVSATEYTTQNFTYCVQNVLSSITGTAVQPLTFVTETILKVVDNIKESLNAIRAMFDKIRTFFQAIAQELMGRLMNIMIPLQQIIISFQDLIGKIQGTMTGGLFTLLGSYYTLKSMMGAIAQFIVTILVALAATIAVLWAVPFTWGFAAVNTGIFLAIAIPMAIILAFMSSTMHIKGYKIPKVKCFDKNTNIVMNDGSVKTIKEIIVGDVLINNNIVTGKIIVETEGSVMYNLDGIIVSNSHVVKYLNSWIPVSNHPNAKLCTYNEPYLYCLNTSSKIISINGHLFSDWDEITDEDIKNIQINSNCVFYEKNDIHKYIDSGFVGNTKIKLKNGSIKNIKDIFVGDILEDNECVYGIVEIDGIKLHKQYTYYLANKVFEGGPNLSLCDKKFNFWSTLNLAEKYDSCFCLDINLNYREQRDKTDNKLYHLLTDKKTFYINNIKFYDYNASIDLFLDKNRGKLLSMKYV
jgi:hypothetical protein